MVVTVTQETTLFFDMFVTVTSVTEEWETELVTTIRIHLKINTVSLSKQT